jgi:hypothetical protein
MGFLSESSNLNYIIANKADIVNISLAEAMNVCHNGSC